MKKFTICFLSVSQIIGGGRTTENHWDFESIQKIAKILEKDGDMRAGGNRMEGRVFEGVGKSM